MKTNKPLLAEVVSAAEQRAKELGRQLPQYNIEIKSRPEWDGTKAPDPASFARLLLAEVERLGITDRTCIQSFDIRALEEVHSQAPEVVTAYLVEALDTLQENLDKLSFTPAIYSPYYMLVTGNMVKQIHERGMQIIPWTVNDTENMAALKALGVDGIITDYPDRIPE
jgi:glycerophosphoryl diester phosphodiesterase